MTSFLTIINLIIFLLLSAIHFYWLAGGKWGLNVAVPTHALSDKALFQPGIIATLVVSFGLLGFAFTEYYHLSPVAAIPPQYHKVASALIIGIFALRAVGDFKYVGIFKKIKNTRFARNDTTFYTPLCIWLAVSQAIIYYQNSF